MESLPVVFESQKRLARFLKYISNFTITPVYAVRFVGKRLSLHTSLVAHQAGAYPGFRSMKRLGVFLLPPGWDASPSQGYPQQ